MSCKFTTPRLSLLTSLAILATLTFGGCSRTSSSEYHTFESKSEPVQSTDSSEAVTRSAKDDPGDVASAPANGQDGTDQASTPDENPSPAITDDDRTADVIPAVAQSDDPTESNVTTTSGVATEANPAIGTDDVDPNADTGESTQVADSGNNTNVGTASDSAATATGADSVANASETPQVAQGTQRQDGTLPADGTTQDNGEPREIKLLISEKEFHKDGEGVLRVTYDDIDLLKILNMEPVPANAPEHFPNWLRQLDGTRIRIRGFMYPTFEATGLTQFLIARDNGICCFVREPKIYDIIRIEMREGLTSDYIEGRPFDVVGVFHIDPLVDEGDLYQLYRIDDAKVIDRRR